VTLRLRDAAPGDIPTLLALIHRLAVYERLADRAVATPDLLARHLFGATPRAAAMLAERDGDTVGFALWFFSYSTFTGRPSLYIEDVFVDERARGQGIGRRLFADLARRALEADCARLEWSVLDWNAPAIAFYRGLGAAALDDWTVQRLTGAALERLAAEGGPATTDQAGEFSDG
jgi:GNAT superfamily N-acetyltransferase